VFLFGELGARWSFVIPAKAGTQSELAGFRDDRRIPPAPE